MQSTRDLVVSLLHPCPLAVGALANERPEAELISLSLRDCALRAFPPRLRRGDAKQEKRTGARVNSAPVSFVLCGERGIRTPGSFHFNSFQDCRFKPLTHLSFPLVWECKDILKKHLLKKKLILQGLILRLWRPWRRIST